MSKLDDLVVEASRRATEQATIYNGREPTLAEASLVLLQAQLAVLASSMFDDDELVEYWESVISVVRGTVNPNEAS